MGKSTQFDRVLNNALRHGWCTFECDTSRALTDVASLLGIPRPSRSNEGLTDVLRVRSADQVHQRSLSAVFGVGAFPWHTDYAHLRIPPRFVLLRSLSPPGVRPTLILDSRSLASEPEARAALKREVWFVNGGRGRFFTPLLNDTLVPDAEIFRFDRCVMRIADEAAQASSRIIKLADLMSPTCRIEWQLGVCLLLDNWRMLHARSKEALNLEGISSGDSARILERALVDVPGGQYRVLGLRRALAEG